MKIYIYAFLVALAISVVCGFAIIPILKRLKFGQNILGYVEEHNYKNGTPTMGGMIFIVGALFSFFIFSDSDRYLSIVCITVGIAYMVVGFIDDFIKIKLKRNMGLNAIQKILFELVISLTVSYFAYKRSLTREFLPFFKTSLDLGFWFIPLCVFVFLATTNSVNLTDGLDGLAGGVSYLYFALYAIVILLEIQGNIVNYANFYEYENIAVLCFCLSGALVGYLIFNTYKASVFMGDTGSLSLGGFVASTGILCGNTFYIPILGITFVIYFKHISNIASTSLQAN